MRWPVLGGLCLAAVLSIGLAGCDGGTMDEGMPQGNLKPDVPLDPKMVDMTGRSFSDQKKAAAKNAAAIKNAPAPAPSGGDGEKSE